MAHKRSFNSLLPKPIKVKRTSVSCNSSAQWIDACCNPKLSVGQRRSFRRISNVISRTDSLLQKSEFVIPDVSPTSSPEDEFLTYSGHEVLTIESEELVCKPQNPTDDRISDSCSLPSSQHLSQQSDYLRSDDSDTPPHISLPISEPPRNPSKNTSTIDYLNQLKHDATEIPFISLAGTNAREKQVKDQIDVVDRLRTIHRRLNSERSIWLHQRASGRESALIDRKTKLFRIDSNNAGQSVGLSGLVAFKATAIDTPTEPGGATETDLGDSLTAIVLLPVSGTLHSSHKQKQPSYVGDLQTIVLGDIVKPGDVLRVFSPWLCIPSQGGSHPPLFHSFFWVERIRGFESPSWLPVLRPCDSLLQNKPTRIVCSCHLSDSKMNILSCPKRFRIDLSCAILLW